MKKNIIFLAPPAAGKGTQSDILKDRYKIAHISTGDLLREEVDRGSSLSNFLKEQMKLGKLISDEIVTDLLKKRLQSDDCTNGFILDGYPRNINQANDLTNILESMDKQINYVFYLQLDKNTALKRACGRLMCPNCGKIYNKYFEQSKPKVDNMCDECKVSLYQRADDNEESFINRFDTYVKSTEPLINYYKEKGILYEIDSNGDKDSITKAITDILDK